MCYLNFIFLVVKFKLFILMSLVYYFSCYFKYRFFVLNVKGVYSVEVCIFD